MDELKYKNITSCFIYLFTSTIFFLFHLPWSFTVYKHNHIHPTIQPPLAQEFNRRAPSDYTANATYITSFSLTRIFSCNPKSNFIIVPGPQIVSNQQQ